MGNLFWYNKVTTPDDEPPVAPPPDTASSLTAAATNIAACPSEGCASITLKSEAKEF